MSTYTPTSDKMVHDTSVDFIRPAVHTPVVVNQYDNKLPILAVKLYQNGVPYPAGLLTGVTANIRFGKKNNLFVYNPALGFDSTGTIVYFEITYQMTTEWGKFKPNVEIMIDDDKIGATGFFDFEVMRNSIQEGDIEDSTEFHTLDEAAERAETAATNAASSALEASAYATNAANSASNAATSESNAATSESNASTSASNAATSASNASTSASNAATSESNASTSATNAATAATEAGNQAQRSEGFAVGTHNGSPVPSTDEAYHYNSKFFADQASADATYAHDAIDTINRALQVATFTVNTTTGNLEYTSDSAFVFEINEQTGNLEWDLE